ncbi:hypothetical protein D1AOALGA4SA_9223 [Olavius algarvensis Delta 1 endosymbiont]|nr:hypothetical protein D1AOALGA4SA_9223 [Olavius algarvensis Delta 1 endosymbiont]
MSINQKLTGCFLRNMDDLIYCREAGKKTRKIHPAFHRLTIISN